MKAVVYTSNTGSAQFYGQIISQELNIHVYSAKEAKENLREGSEIIYVGWIMAGSIKGYSHAAKKYKIRAVCAVGMCKTGSQTKEIRVKNSVPTEIPLFTLQGNFSVKKLHGMYKFIMSIMLKTAGKALAKKQDRTAEEEDMLEMMTHGENKVRKENLAEFFEKFKKEGV